MSVTYSQRQGRTQVFLSKEEIVSLLYHNLFEYPLSMAELIKWSAGPKASNIKSKLSNISVTNGYYYLGNSKGIILKRFMRKRISIRKFEIAQRAAKIISVIPTVKMVGVTGALAMENASDESDIDLMIITQKGTLWTTRLLTYLVLRIAKYALRKPGDKIQKDKLCLNMWMDEKDMVWPLDKRNIYTAHEIAQIKPLVNRDKKHEKFVLVNNWIKEFWPNAVNVRNQEVGIRKGGKEPLIRYSLFVIRFFEWIAFRLQYAYMKRKITREVVTTTRAYFHPTDWSEYILLKLDF